MNFMRKLAGWLCAALCLPLLGACGSDADSRSIIMAAPPTSSVPSQVEAEAAEQEEPAPEDVAMDLSVASRTISSGYAGNAYGCYRIQTHNDTSADVVYIDYDARTMDLLPGMTQEVTGLSGKLAGVLGGVSPVWAGEHLFIFQQRASDENAEGGAASVLRLGADGTNPVRCTFPQSVALQLSGAALWDGESLYFIVQDFAEEDGAYALARLDTTTMEYELLHHYEPGWEYSIEGYWSMGPVVQAASALPPTNDPQFNDAWAGRSFVLFRQGMVSGARSELYSYTQGEPVLVDGGTAYRWNQDEGNLYAMSAETGEEQVLAGGFAPKSYDYAQLPATELSGFVRIEFSAGDGRNNTYYAVDPDDGAVTQLQTGSLGDNVTVCAEGEGVFLVRHGEKWVRRELVEPGYDPAADTVQSYDSRYVSMPEYALITTGDYWAGKRTFVDIEDVIYGPGTRNSGGYTSYNAQQNAEGGAESQATEEAAA